MMLRWLPVIACLVALSFTTVSSRAQERRKPIVAGNLTVNPKEIIAVFRPVEQQAVAVYVGRPGQAVQAIVFHDVREAQAVFNELWNNEEIVKDPGQEDGRPLTRMMLKSNDAERRIPSLIVNVDRLVACAWDQNRRALRVFLDKPIATALLDPNGGERDWLELQNNNAEADLVMAAYKVCTHGK
jgi:hypothetical protein